MQVCPACQASNNDSARFCSRCGLALALPSALSPGTVLQVRYAIEAQSAERLSLTGDGQMPVRGSRETCGPERK